MNVLLLLLLLLAVAYGAKGYAERCGTNAIESRSGSNLQLALWQLTGRVIMPVLVGMVRRGGLREIKDCMTGVLSGKEGRSCSVRSKSRGTTETHIVSMVVVVLVSVVAAVAVVVVVVVGGWNTNHLHPTPTWWLLPWRRWCRYR
jgi:hypothetical protein